MQADGGTAFILGRSRLKAAFLENIACFCEVVSRFLVWACGISGRLSGRRDAVFGTGAALGPYGSIDRSSQSIELSPGKE